ncbi:MAG TPA: flagellar assembly protein FliW [Solirubrobacterales bacterium]|jgi:flagellar assembly factor FliW|nr:flagellar assembly protein FliW [Solirubrobacterales bacterium]
MSETVNSSRFGELEVPAEALIDFPDGMIGVGGNRFALLSREESGAFKWLQDTSQEDLALPVTDPFSFFPDYEVVLSDAEAERIGITDPGDAEVLVVVRAAEDPSQISANLLAPILVAAGVGHQVMNEASWAPLREPLLSGGRREVAA